MQIETIMEYTLNPDERMAFQKVKNVLFEMIDYLDKFGTEVIACVDSGDVYSTVGVIEAILDGSK